MRGMLASVFPTPMTTQLSYLTLSPQKVIRDHVLILCRTLMVFFQPLEAVNSRMKLFFCSRRGRLFSPGTWKLSVVDLKR